MEHRSPRSPIRLVELTSPFFLVALALLLVNDHLLKGAMPGVLTGKLSDLVGLFAFAWLFFVLFPRHRIAVAITTALTFTLWKLPTADRFIAWFNELGTIQITRVVDPTDLIALLVIPVAMVLHERLDAPDNRTSAVRTALVLPILAVTFFAFSATSCVDRFVYEEGYTIAGSRAAVNGALDRMTDDTVQFPTYIPVGEGERGWIWFRSTIIPDDTLSLPVKFAFLIEEKGSTEVRFVLEQAAYYLPWAPEEVYAPYRRYAPTCDTKALGCQTGPDRTSDQDISRDHLRDRFEEMVVEEIRRRVED